MSPASRFFCSRETTLMIVLAVAFGALHTLAAEPEVLRRWDFNKTGDVEGWNKGGGVQEMSVADGCLRLTTSAPDAYVFAPAVELPLDGLVVCIGLRGTNGGESEVYWTTRDDPAWSEKQCARQYVSNAGSMSEAGGFVTMEFPVGRPADAGRTVTAFRIDPFNGAASNRIEMDFVELVRKPPVLEPRFSFKSHLADVGQAVDADVSVRQLDGRGATDAFRVEIVAGSAGKPVAGGSQEARLASPGAFAAASSVVRFDELGVQPCRARIASSGRVIADFEAAIIIGQGESLPTLPGLRSDRVRLDLVPTADRKHVGAGRWMASGKLAGWLLPLAQVTVLNDGTALTRVPVMSIAESSPDRVRLTGHLGDLAGWEVDMMLSLRQAGEHEVIDVIGRLRGPRGGQVLDFSVPVLRMDRDPAGEIIDRYAIFGGLEFLEPGWSSSSHRAVGEKYADRRSPHPFKVTLPITAIEARGLTSAMLWQPGARAGETGPCPTFASPNHVDGQPNHLMRLSVPMREENEFQARCPHILANNELLEVRAVLVAEPQVPVAMTARWWYDACGIPVPPPRPHDDREMYDLAARSLGETMYWPAEKGWRHHWYMGKSSYPVPEMAATLIGHSVETGQKQWVERTGQAGKQIIDAAIPLATRILHDGAARNATAAMQPDGTWPFVNTDAMRQLCLEVTQGRHDSLGQDGSTSVGTCVQQVLPILKYARLSGTQAHIDAGIRALEAMRRFRVPRGAQVWEVHQEIPDIRAAALATEAYRLGFEITGDRQWLDDASYWAWTGVSFVYSWHVPIEDRGGFLVATRDKDDWNRHSIPLGEAYRSGQPRVTPYGTVPVLGPTCYVINWFGVLVQWCGLEWAEHVIELDAHRPDPLLRYIADGVVLSGLQQMMDKEPWVGLYPDSWHTQTNLAHAALIYPGLLMRCLQAQGRMPCWSEPWTRVVRDDSGRRRWHVSSWGKPIEVARPLPGGVWTCRIGFLAGQQNELLVSNVDKPVSLRVGGEVIPLLEEHDPVTSVGWRYDPQRRCVLARFLQPSAIAELRVAW